MKSSLFISLILLSVIFISCKQKEIISDQGKIKVAVTILPYSGIVKEIGGEKVELTVLVPPQSACETYEPTPVDIAKAANSKIYFSVGANYAFEKNLLKGISENYRNIVIIDCSKNVEIIGNNPHIWLYPEGLKIIAENIYNALKNLRPELDNYFLHNKEKFINQVDSIDTVIKTNLQQIKNNKILVFHPSWFYFAKQYNLEQIAIENEGKEPTAQDLKKIVDQAKKYKIKTLYTEPGTNEESASALKGELKADIEVLNPMEENILKNLVVVAQKIFGSAK